jgi:hypothetical protein
MNNSNKALGQSGNRLRIALIGGHARNVRHLIERGRMVGWQVEGHSGVVKGRGIKELRTRVERADIVIITTQINSHGGMFRAKEFARRFGRFTTVVRRESFAEIKNAIAQFQSCSHLG